MRDEFEDEELMTDPSARKKATDWLMQVISARKPINLHLNGSAYEEDGGSAVAVEEPAEEPIPAKWVGEFSAEDLCGAPAVPVIKVEPAARNGMSEVTADDVCWVPEDRRLKPEPPQPPPQLAEPAPRVLQMMAARDSQKEPEVRQPEMRKPPTAPVAEEFYGKTNLAADPASRRSPDEVAIEDISREPAPYVVEPMPAWGAFSENFHVSDMLDRPITEADIARDWVVQSIDPSEEKGKDGVVLPFSFKVLKSRDAALAESASTTVLQSDPSPAPVVEASRIGTVAVVEEVQETATTGAPEALALPELPALTVAAELESAPAVEPESIVVAPEETPVAAEPAVHEAEPEPQVAIEVEPPPASGPEQQLPQPVEAEAQAEETSPEIEAKVDEPVPEEIAAEDASTRQPESVFAREGFWNGAVPVEEAPRDMDLKPSHPVPEEEDLGGTGEPPEEWVSAWKALLRIGSALPWMAKALPAAEAGAMADGAGTPGEVRQDVAGLRLVQYEIRTTVQDHTLHLKRMDEQLGRIRESLESKSSNSDDLAENVESMSRLVRIVGFGLGGLVLVLILLVAIMLAHGR